MSQSTLAASDSTGAVSASPTSGLALSTLLMLAVGFRLPAFFIAQYGLVPAFSDFAYYHQLASLAAQGYLPEIHFWVEYPPILPWLAVGAFRLSLLLPAWTYPSFWFDLIFTLILAAADCLAIVAIDHLGDRIQGPGGGRPAATLYAALFVPTFALLGWFDTLPTALLLLALDLILAATQPGQARGRSHRTLVAAGIAVGIGAMLKFFPLLAVPAVVIRRASPPGLAPSVTTSTGQGMRVAILVGSALATTLAICVPFLLINSATFLATFRNLLARGSWESPWALLDGNYQPGVVASLADRLFYNASALWGQPDQYPIFWWLAVGVAGVIYGWQGWRAWRSGTAQAAIALTGLSVVFLLLLSRGFSIQFTIWLLPFVVLLLPGLAGAILAVLLALNNFVLEGYVYIGVLPTVHGLLWITVAARTALLLWLALECCLAIDPRTASRVPVLRRRLGRPTLAVGFIAVGLALLPLRPAVAAAILARDADAPAIETLAQENPATSIVVDDAAIYDRLAPYLKSRELVVVAQPGLLAWTGDQSLYQRLHRALTAGQAVVLVTDPTETQAPLAVAIRQRLAARYQPGTATTVGPLRLERFQPDDPARDQASSVRFGSQLELTRFRVRSTTITPGQSLGLTLQWRALTDLSQDYTISLQILDPRGTLIAQHDAMPVENTMPTSGWRAGELVDDAVAIPLPATLVAGSYQILVAVYDHATLTRLRASSGSGPSLDHAVLATVRRS